CVDADKAAWAISKVYLYTDAYCTTGKQTITMLGDTVSSPAEANKTDFAGTPDLGSATIANGTYNCVATKMWDNITYSPATTTTSGNCAKATDYTQDICGSDNASSVTAIYDPDNSSTYNCSLDSAPTNEWIWIYFSTASTDSDNVTLADLENDFHPPTSDNLSNGVPLASALVVSAASSGSLKTTITNRVADDTTECMMYKPAFSFE
ncbi:MAG: hypothetical protein HN351_05180, partial [Deltaproteobacteria bacterium]|nr:hypothetical protein [Deltaproteobacteria bacterium]